MDLLSVEFPPWLLHGVWLDDRKSRVEKISRSSERR